MSERRTCRVVGLARSSLQYRPAPKDDDALRLALIRLAKPYGRYGHRKITDLLHIEGWRVNHKKIERLWREEGLQPPQRHKKRRRLHHKDMAADRVSQRLQWRCRFADPVTKGRAIEIKAVALKDPALPVERKVVGILAHQNVRQQSRAGTATLDRA